MGQDTINYWATIKIDDVIKNVDDAIRVMVIKNGNKVIINTAEISKNTDKDGKDVEDIDSTPGNNKEDEDDIDKEYLVLKQIKKDILVRLML